MCFLSMSFVVSSCCGIFFFFFKQKTAYEMRISDWSSDVCSSDLRDLDRCSGLAGVGEHQARREAAADGGRQGEAENGGAGAAEVGKGHGHSCAGMNGGVVPPS